MFKVLFGCFALGVASTLLLLVIVFIAFGNQAVDLIFGILNAAFIIGFGIAWYPFVNKRLK